jgi:Na+-driven multidrug efflux pump
MQMCCIPISGFTNGVQPIISYNYGAQKIHRVKATVKRMLFICFGASLLMGILIPLFPTQIARIFTTNLELLSVIKIVLPIYFGAVWIFGIQMAAQSTFVGLGKAKTSLFIALLRKVILLIPLALIFPKFLGVNGILLAEPIASTVSAVTSGILLYLTYKKLEKA